MGIGGITPAMKLKTAARFLRLAPLKGGFPETNQKNWNFRNWQKFFFHIHGIIEEYPEPYTTG
jgi:hypothetical protein